MLKTKLREHALILRALSESLRANSSLSEDAIRTTLRSKKEALMKEIYVVMTATLGVPPRPNAPFTWEYYTKDGKFATWAGTPSEFYKAFAYDKYSVSAGVYFFHVHTVAMRLANHATLVKCSRLTRSLSSTTRATHMESFTRSTSLVTSGAGVLFSVCALIHSVPIPCTPKLTTRRR